MSRIGKLAIKIPEQVKVDLKGEDLTVSGPRGLLHFSLPTKIKLVMKENEILFEREDSSRLGRSLHGLTRALVANMIKGVNEGFRKELELQGVGYRAKVEEGELTLTIGFSHPVKVKAPEGIKFSVAENKIIIEGVDKQVVGEMASQIRNLKPPEPYKGKGIRYLGEKIRRKAGKAAKVVGGKV